MLSQSHRPHTDTLTAAGFFSAADASTLNSCSSSTVGAPACNQSPITCADHEVFHTCSMLATRPEPSVPICSALANTSAYIPMCCSCIAASSLLICVRRASCLNLSIASPNSATANLNVHTSQQQHASFGVGERIHLQGAS